MPFRSEAYQQQVQQMLGLMGPNIIGCRVSSQVKSRPLVNLEGICNGIPPQGSLFAEVEYLLFPIG